MSMALRVATPPIPIPVTQHYPKIDIEQVRKCRDHRGIF